LAAIWMPVAFAAPRRETVVSPAWVQARLGKVIVIEASWAPLETAKEYRAGHIPTARHANTDDFENGYPRWHLLAPAQIHAAIGRLGIAPSSTVVVYSHDSVAAARVWWILLYAGAADVRYLNGGLAAWKRAGFAVETAVPRWAPVPFTASVRGAVLADTEYVRSQDSNVHRADTRRQAEFTGRDSGYEYLAAKGRLPGAIHAGHAGKGGPYLNADGTLRNATDVEEMWRAAGLLDGREIVFYCGSGWRSSLAFLHAWILGISNVRNYSDGWSGWSTRYARDAAASGITPGWRQEPSANPVASGDPLR
jgi:thiosulfate/3-mercaptopyruvate sulfurtransferase